ncbi:MAG: C-GCAxxG-C-C family protein [Candidatus Krumholzibacteriia bacterium]
MERVDRAAGYFVDGFNCAQSVLAAFGPDCGLDRDSCLRVAAPFGGGVSRTDGMCGAATGAILALGLVLGHCDPDDEAGQDRIRALTRSFLARFAARLGSTRCTDILGYDLSRPGVAEMVKAEGLSLEPCPAAVKTAAELLVEMLDDGPTGP